MKYDVSNMKNAIIGLAASSHNNADYCLKRVSQMHFKSSEDADDIRDNEVVSEYYNKFVKENNEESKKALELEPIDKIVFFDVEVFPNLFIICWKFKGKEQPVRRMINPNPDEVKQFMRFFLDGFNCRRYDNHMLYARSLGYSLYDLYLLSKAIIGGDKNVFFPEAYSVSYTDIYDFSTKKQSLKKWEIELGALHKELGLNWDEPVPEELWLTVAEYCDNDVISTELVFDHLQADWNARLFLADVAGLTPNDTTNKLTGRIIFGDDKTPQTKFIHRNLAEPVFELPDDVLNFLRRVFPEMMSERHGKAGSLLPYFEGYIFENGRSTYRDEVASEGGYVHVNPGFYGNVALLDITSMHPHSAIAECVFGVIYTQRFYELLQARMYIKHKEFDKAATVLNGLLAKYVKKVEDGEISAKDLAYGLKIAINMVYGMTSAGFDNLFKDPNNIDNIVAKRGALFMIDLKHEVEDRGFTVVHIKTDSIKIADATPEIIEFVMNFGKRYGYTFEHEATYEKLCIVNKATYVAKYKEPEKDDNGNDIWWTAVAEEFKVPYVFKKGFTKEQIVFKDLCNTFSVTKGELYLDMNENIPQLSPEEDKELTTLSKLFDSDDKEKMDKYMSKYGVDADYLGNRYSELTKKDEATHNLKFIGKVGEFVPVKEGKGGGILYRIQDGKAYAATGSSGYRWLEPAVVKDNYEELIDMEYFDNLLRTAIEDIEFYVDYNWFVSDEPYIFNGEYVFDGEYKIFKPEYQEEVPFR